MLKADKAFVSHSGFSLASCGWTMFTLTQVFRLTTQSPQILLKLRSKTWRRAPSPSGGPWALMGTAPSQAMTLNAKINQVSPSFPPAVLLLPKALLLLAFHCKHNLDSGKLRGSSFCQSIYLFPCMKDTHPHFLWWEWFCVEVSVGSSLPLFSWNKQDLNLLPPHGSPWPCHHQRVHRLLPTQPGHRHYFSHLRIFPLLPSWPHPWSLATFSVRGLSWAMVICAEGHVLLRQHWPCRDLLDVRDRLVVQMQPSTPVLPLGKWLAHQKPRNKTDQLSGPHQARRLIILKWRWQGHLEH